MNILYIDHGNVVSDGHMYQYYGDLYRELKKKANVILFQNSVKNFKNINNSNIDCVIFGLGYFTQTSPHAYRKIEGLSECEVPVVCLLHKPQTMLEEKLNFCKINNIDILMDTNITYKEFGERVNAESIRFWFTANPKIYYPRQVEKTFDVGFSGADHGGDKIKGPTNNLRNRIRNILENTKYNLFWNSTKDLSYRINSVEEYATRINQSKIWVATTGPTNDISPRYFEVMLSKTLLLCNKMPYQYEGVFRDGENCVMFKNDLSDLEQKLDYYMNNPEKRQQIILNAFEVAKENYTWEHMADKLLKTISEVNQKRRGND
jgi:spore maturation protein CgeB